MFYSPACTPDDRPSAVGWEGVDSGGRCILPGPGNAGEKADPAAFAPSRVSPIAHLDYASVEESSKGMYTSSPASMPGDWLLLVL